jgi:hypothetical protein
MAIEHIERDGATTERKVVINACKEALEQPALTDEKCGGCGMNYCECGERIDWSDPRYDD